jgi:hypothetical protein
MSRPLLSLALTGALLAGLGAPEALARQTQSAPLSVAPDGHRLQTSDGKPFLWVGDTAWGMMQYLTREEVDRYLDDRQKLGFSVIQTVAHWYPHGGGMPLGPSNKPDAYGFRPFEGPEDNPDVTKPLVVPGGSPEAPNDYWDHADYIVRAVAKRGMYLGLLPIWGRAYVTSTFGGTKQVYDVEKARTFGAFLGARYRDQPHIIWMIGGDTKAQAKGYDKNQNMLNFDARPIFRAMAEGLGRGVTGKPLAWNKPDPAWDKLFITYHPDGDPWENSSTWFHSDAWLDANGVEVWRETDQVYPVMLADYQKAEPTKPSLFLEGSYEFGTYRDSCGSVTPLKVRRQFYHTFFAGGAGHTYGAGPIWAMRGTAGDYNCGYTWSQALAFPGARQVADIGAKFLAAQDWASWKPTGGIVETFTDGDTRKVSVVAGEGRSALVYFADAAGARIHNPLAGSATASWFDPRDGRQVSAGAFAKGQTREMMPPERWEDAILVLKAD